MVEVLWDNILKRIFSRFGTNVWAKWAEKREKEKK